MRNIVLLFLITLLFFSCTIEKRRYFKGYHVTHSTSSGTARSTGSGEPHSTSSGEPHSTSSGTARSTGSGEPRSTSSGTTRLSGSGETRSTSPETGEELKKGGVAIVQAHEPEEGKQEQIAACEKNETCAASEAQKPQRGDIILGSGVIDVTRVIFGMLSIVSFALALLFFGSAIFAIDSLVMTVLLLIGGGFALAGLVFLVIYGLIKRRQSVDGQIVGQANEPEPSNSKPKRVRNVLIPFVICGLFALALGLKIGSGTSTLVESIEYLLAFVGYVFLAIILLIITIVRLVRKRKQSRLSKEPIAPAN